MRGLENIMEKTEYNYRQVHAAEINRIKAEVEKTHPGLGHAAALTVEAVAARRPVFIIGPAATGKSTIAAWIAGQAVGGSMAVDRVSMYALGKTIEAGNPFIPEDFSGLIVVDDLQKSMTDYARAQTVNTLVAIVDAQGIRIDMPYLKASARYNPSVIICGQPNTMKLAKEAQEHYGLSKPLIIERGLVHSPLYTPELPVYKRGIDCVIDWTALESTPQRERTLERLREREV